MTELTGPTWGDASILSGGRRLVHDARADAIGHARGITSPGRASVTGEVARTLGG